MVQLGECWLANAACVDLCTFLRVKFGLRDLLLVKYLTLLNFGDYSVVRYIFNDSTTIAKIGRNLFPPQIF